MDAEAHAKHRRALTKASEHLLGLVTGMIADQHLHDMEIQLLRTWLSANKQVTAAFPGSVLASRIETIFEDGRVTEDERNHLLTVLRDLSVTDFSETGSITPEVTRLPISDEGSVRIRGKVVCLTGEFLFGTRAACLAMTEAAGAQAVDTVTRAVSFLVVGTNVSAAWANTSYGRKMQRAVDMQAKGHQIRIISERKWLTIVAPANES